MSNEVIRISPEGLKAVEAYLENGQNLELTADALGLEKADLHALLNKRESKAYLDRLYMEAGFRNRGRMGELMDEIINAKLEEMADTGMGSGKDILEILQVAHKMRMDEMAMQIKLMEAENKAAIPNIQINQQINNGGSNYNSLLEKLLKR